MRRVLPGDATQKGLLNLFRTFDALKVATQVKNGQIQFDPRIPCVKWWICLAPLALRNFTKPIVRNAVHTHSNSCKL